MFLNFMRIGFGENLVGFFIAFVQAVILSSYNLEQVRDKNFNQLPHELKYDFIIVGGGTTGCVLASRLSDDFTVLLIEAGGTPHLFTRVPKIYFELFDDPTVDWKYEMVPQTHSSFGMNNNITKWPMGKGLGGSSIINGMIYIRGNVQGFDKYAEYTGDPIWTLDNVLKYYKVLEDYKGYFDDGNHGHGGGLSLEKTPLVPFVSNLMEAGIELGYNVRDPNTYGPLTEGFSPTDFYVKNGRRWNAYDGFLRPAMEKNKRNLKVLRFSYVYKVLLDESNRAYGVEFIRHGKRHRALAKKEVILSAGSIQSAKILMLSGIGPKQHLLQVGVQPRIDLPVGEILQDKYGALLGPFTVNDGASYRTDRDLTKQSFLQWFTYGGGTLSTPQVEATFTVTSDYAKANGRLNELDIHSYIIANSICNVEEKMFGHNFNLRPQGVEYLRKARGRDSFLQFVTISKPFGTGTLKLKSADPFDDVLIDPRYLQDPRDMAILIEALRFSTKVVEETKSFKKINGRLIPTHFPGCERFKFKSDGYWECLGRHTTLTAFKYSSTAPMGNSTDPFAVVDSRLRVLKSKGLRVIDSSVLQERYVSINQNTCMMIGRLAAEFLIDEWSSKCQNDLRGC